MSESDFDLSPVEEPQEDIFHIQFNQVEQFCTPDSITASANYVNTLLTCYGYPVPLIFDSTDVEERCKIVNCIYAIINDKKKEEQERRDLEKKIEKLTKENLSLQEEKDQIKRDMNHKNKQYLEAKSKLEANEEGHKQRAEDNNRLRDEVTRLKNTVLFVKTQYGHESKRLTQDLEKSQERLTKIMDKHYKINVGQMNMNGHFETTENNTADSDKVIQIRTMYDDLLSKSKDRERQLSVESEELRLCLITLYTGTRRLLEAQIQRYQNLKPSEPTVYHESGRFLLPVDCGAKEAMVYVEDLLDKMKEEWDAQIRDQPPEFTEEDRQENEEHIKLLQKTIEDLIEKSTQAEQEYNRRLNMYRKFEQGGFFDTLYPTPNSTYVQSDDDDEVVEEEELSVSEAKKKEALSIQRQVSEAAVELTVERAKFEAERLAFQQLKRKAALENILGEEVSVDEVLLLTPRKYTNSFHAIDTGRPRKKLKSFLGAPALD